MYAFTLPPSAIGLEPQYKRAVNESLLMAPVRCIDCEQYVPLGWVEFGKVKCPQNWGSSGVQYGHRVERSVRDNLLDSTVTWAFDLQALNHSAAREV